MNQSHRSAFFSRQRIEHPPPLLRHSGRTDVGSGVFRIFICKFAYEPVPPVRGKERQRPFITEHPRFLRPWSDLRRLAERTNYRGGRLTISIATLPSFLHQVSNLWP